MHSRPPGRHQPICLLLACVASIVTTMWLAPAGAASPSQPAPHPDASGQEWHVLVDRAALLDEGQRTSATNDAFRLNAVGIPTQIVIEPTGFDADEAARRADDLRLASGIESVAGADDGMLIYASVAPSGPEIVTLAISVGARTLPAGGLTRGDLDTIRETIVLPQLDAGHPARAIVYSMREMLYQFQFTPPPIEDGERPWSGVRQEFQVVSVVVAAGAVALLAWSRNRAWRRWAIAAGCMVALVSFDLAVRMASGLGIAAALLLGSVTAALAVRVDTGLRYRRYAKRLGVTPRPPGSIQAASK